MLYLIYHFSILEVFILIIFLESTQKPSYSISLLPRVHLVDLFYVCSTPITCFDFGCSVLLNQVYSFYILFFVLIGIPMPPTLSPEI